MIAYFCLSLQPFVVIITSRLGIIQFLTGARKLL